MSELQRLLSHTHGVMSCTVVVYMPTEADERWADSATVRQARSMPDVNVILDADGEILKELGLCTSGATILFDVAGNPRFHGGITVSRGHEGSNLGSEAIRDLVEGRQPIVCEAPVFGCRITE